MSSQKPIDHHDDSVNRRTFLKSSTVAAAAAGATGLALGRSAHAAGSDVIKIGMVGCGGRCTGAAAQVLQGDPGTQLVAMSDLFADRVEGKRAALKRMLPGRVDVADERCVVGLDGYKKVIESVDVVLIACAAKFHPMYAKAGIDAGKHVFVEKPHAIDPVGIKVVDQASELARKKGLGLLSGLHSRFDAGYAETIQRIHDGQIGEIISIEENFIRGPYGNTIRPKGLRELEVQYGNQYRFAWLCGDDVPQSLVHNLDRASWAMQGAVPVKCHGLGGRSTSYTLLGDVFDHDSVVYQYENGIRLYAFCRTIGGCYNESSSIILGSKGIAYVTGRRITGQNPWEYKGKREDGHAVEQREFLKSIRAGQPLNSGHYMAQSTLIGIMGQMSCYSGKEVTWKQISESNYVITPRPEDCTWDMEPPVKPDADGIYPVCATPGLTKNV